MDDSFIGWGRLVWKIFIKVGREGDLWGRIMDDFIGEVSTWESDPDDLSNPDYQANFAGLNVMDFTAKYDGYIPSKIAANIEEKMDDKSLDTGSIRMGLCSDTIPENSNMIDGEFGKEESTGYGDIATYEELADAKNGACDEITFRLDL